MLVYIDFAPRVAVVTSRSPVIFCSAFCKKKMFAAVKLNLNYSERFINFLISL